MLLFKYLRMGENKDSKFNSIIIIFGKIIIFKVSTNLIFPYLEILVQI